MAGWHAQQDGEACCEECGLREGLACIGFA